MIIIEAEHIDFIIPEYLLEPPIASQFLNFLAPQLFLKKSSIHFSSIPVLLVLDFYETHGRVFSNK